MSGALHHCLLFCQFRSTDPSINCTGKKVKMSLCLISLALCHEDVQGSGGIAPLSLTSAPNETAWSATRPCRFVPRGHWIGGWVGPRVGLEAVETRELSYCRKSNPGCPARKDGIYDLMPGDKLLILQICSLSQV
jgi:hypothetical protein